MSSGHGKTVKSSDGSRNNRDIGQNKSSELPPQKLPRSKITFENKENIPGDETSDAILSTSCKENLCAMLKSAMEPLDSDNGFQYQPVYATSDLQQRDLISRGIEESTEVINISSSYNEHHFGTGRATPSTDSDVEILTQEEIAESHSSASGTSETAMNPLQTCLTEKEKDQKHSEESKPEKHVQEIIVMDSIFGSLTAKDVPRLLKVIDEQTVKIEMLKSTIDRYLEKHKTLFKHVEALRLALNIKDIEDKIMKLDVNPNEKL